MPWASVSFMTVASCLPSAEVPPRGAELLAAPCWGAGLSPHGPARGGFVWAPGGEARVLAEPYFWRRPRGRFQRQAFGSVASPRPFPETSVRLGGVECSRRSLPAWSVWPGYMGDSPSPPLLPSPGPAARPVLRPTAQAPRALRLTEGRSGSARPPLAAPCLCPCLLCWFCLSGNRD